jgi:hypothetical protein
MNESEEQALERYLQRSSPLSRAYRKLGEERPSPALDQAVISTARGAIAEHRLKQRATWRWSAMTALAATILLSFAVVMRLALEPENHGTLKEPEPKTELDRPSPARDNNAPQARNVESVETTTVNAPAVPAADALARVDTPDRGRVVTSAPVKGARASRTMGEHAVLTNTTRQSVSLNVAEEARAKVESETLAAPAAAAIGSANEAASAAAPGAGSAVGTADAQARPTPPKQLEKSSVKPAKEWLEEITRLRESGQLEAAEREYAEFQKVYPDYVPAVAPTR